MQLSNLTQQGQGQGQGQAPVILPSFNMTIAAAAAGNPITQAQTTQQLLTAQQQQQGGKPLSTYMQRKLRKEAADAAKLAAQQQSAAMMYGGTMGVGGGMQPGMPQFPSFAGLGRPMMPHSGYPQNQMMNMSMGYQPQPSQMQGT